MGNCKSSKNKIVSDSIVKIVDNSQHAYTEPKEPSLSMNPLNSQSYVHSKSLRRINTIKTEEIHEAENAKISNRAKTDAEIHYIKKSLSKHFLFSKLPMESLNMIIRKMQFYSLEAKSIVITQGKLGETFFIVASGKLDVIVDNKIVEVLTKGQSFGELALMHDSPRPATVTASTFTTLWGLLRADFKASIHNSNDKKYQEIKIFISSIPLFDMLTPSQKDMLLELLVPYEFNNSEKIVTEGDSGDLLYIIQKGTVRCTIKGANIRDLNKGDFFGEQALLYNTTRTATITAVGPVMTLSLHRDHITKVLGNQLQQVIYKNTQRMSIEKSSTLKDLTLKQIDLLINAMKISTYPANQILIPKGSIKGLKMFIVLKGSVTISGRALSFLNCIGDAELLQRPTGKYEDNLICLTSCDIAEITRLEIEQLLGGELKKVLEKNVLLNILKKVQIFRTLPLQKFDSLLEVLTTKECPKAQFIFREEDQGLDLFIIKEGEVEIVKNGVVLRKLEKYDYFGERAILFKERRTVSARTNGKLLLWVLHKDEFFRVIDAGMRDQLVRRIQLQDDSLSFESMNLIKLLGTGSFGIVYLALNTITGAYYAIKTVSRAVIAKYSIEEHMKVERRILLKVDHPFIVKLVKTMKDPYRIYYVLEHIRGTGLYETLRLMNLLKIDDSKFYIACIILMLEHLHERSIIYRDLKPENLMIDEEGYLKLIDFGTAKALERRTFTLIGTPQYIAPEVIMGKGYTLSADLWSLGIVSYELVTGRVPFGESEQDPYKIYEMILEATFTYPPTLKGNPRVKIFIDQLLSHNPVARGSVESLKSHKWFIGFNWESLFSKHLKPPFLPIVSNFNPETIRTEFPGKTLQQILIDEELKVGAPEINGQEKNNQDWDDEF